MDFILLNCKHNLNFIIKASLLVIIFTIWCKIRIFFHAPVSILYLPPRAALLPLGESLTIFSVTNFVPTNLLNEFQSSIINVKCFLLLFNEFHFKPISKLINKLIIIKSTTTRIIILIGSLGSSLFSNF